MNIRDSIVAVLSEKGKIVGSGFLVSEKLVLTCAHVVVLAGAIDGDTVQIRFDGRTEKINTLVVPEYWRDVDKGDVAVLRLQNVPQGIEPLHLGNAAGSAGHAFYAYGYAIVTNVQGIGARGKIVDIVDNGRLVQLTSQEPDHGMSGGPVLDEQRRVVIGMVTKGKGLLEKDQNLRNTQTTFATSVEVIREACPELRLTEICPYRSLDVFNEEDAPFFFGREKVLQKLLDSLKREPRFLAVLGPSGSGKSSVVRAGLIPALRQGKVPGSEKWEIVTIRPANDPFDQLAGEGFINPKAGLESSVKTWLADGPNKMRLLLFIDQFEEVLVSTPTDVRQKFIAELAQLLNASVAITLVFTLRDDFYSRFQQDAAQLMDWLEGGFVNIPATLEKDELRIMVVEPARAVGLFFEEGLVDDILDDAVGTEHTRNVARNTVLPLLEFALTQLWEKRQNGQLTHSAYQVIDGVTGGLTQWADKVFYALDENEKLTARLVLSQLVHAGDEKQGIPDTRQVKSVRDLLLSNQDLTMRVINKLIEKRLLTAKRDEKAGLDIVELIHEALLAEWGLLQNWVKDDRPSLIIHQALSNVAKEWSGDISRIDLLYRGKRLEQAREWGNKNKALITPCEELFLDASLKEEGRDEIRKKIFFGMVCAIVATSLFLGPGLWAYHQFLRWAAMGSSKLIEIGGGSMIFGTNDPDRAADEYEPDLIHVDMDDIWVEATEVTYSQYDKCVKANKCSPLRLSMPVKLEKFGNSPVTATAFQAKTYCDWIGRRLPTTYEWELATRGLNGRPWPWYQASLPSEHPINMPGPDKGNVGYQNQGTKPVGSYLAGATSDGIFDLYGNVWEWTNSVLDLQNGEIVQWNGESNVLIIQRGGGWEDTLSRITQIRMSRADDDTSVGFRCVQSYPP